MAKFTINDALAFVTVVEEGNFAAAASKSGITASVISKRISRLETSLQVQLFSRTTRSMNLTESGQIFYERCRRIKNEMDEATNDILEHQTHTAGLLRINSPTSFGQVHLMPVINAFLKTYPEVTIELLLGSQFSQFIYDGLDVAIFINDLPDTHLLKSKQITLRRTGIYASPEYFAQYSKPNHPEDLSQHNCLSYQFEPGKHIGLGQKQVWHFTKQSKEIKVSVTGSLKVNNSQALVNAGMAGIGIIKLSNFMVTQAVKRGKLISVLEAYCEKDIPIHAAYPSKRFISAKTKLFIDFLVEWFKKNI